MCTPSHLDSANERGFDMTDSSVVDVGDLRSEVQIHYAEVAEHPNGEFHFHTGRYAAEQLGYDRELFASLPETAIEAFAGVANPFAWGLPAVDEHVVDIGSGGGTFVNTGPPASGLA